jgi:type II secretory pathway pseudopilin PulG
VIVVIAVVSILASMAVPYAVKFIDMERTESTKRQLEEIHRAIAGDPAMRNAGYVGDMGAMPSSLARLKVQGTQRAPTYGTLGVKYGWDGPYLRIGYSDNAYLYDGWGRALIYYAATGRVRSRGPNASISTDDIWYPADNVAPFGWILVNLHVWRTDNTSGQYVLNPLPSAFPGMSSSVRAYYSRAGLRSTAPLAAGYPDNGAGPPYRLGPIHAGYHELFATCTLPPDNQVGGQAVVYVPGNNRMTQVDLYLR